MFKEEHSVSSVETSKQRNIDKQARHVFKGEYGLKEQTPRLSLYIFSLYSKVYTQRNGIKYELSEKPECDLRGEHFMCMTLTCILGTTWPPMHLPFGPRAPLT